MNDQRLEELLRYADADPPAATASSLAAAVRRRARRRAVLRVAGPAAAAAAALVIALTFGHVGRPDRRIADETPGRPGSPRTLPSSLPAATVDIERLRAECVQLERQADLHAKLAASMVHAEGLAAHRARAASVLAEPDAGQVVAAQLDRAARTLVDFGDDLLRRQAAIDPSARTMAAGAYRDAAALSPDSPAAAVARQRLQEMNI